MNDTPENLRRAFWHCLLTADLNTRYWRQLGQRYSRRDMIAKIFLGATASSTVASWGLWQDFDLLWKALSSASALLAIALPIVDWPKAARKAVSLSAKWQSILVSYELAWIHAEDGGLEPSKLEEELKVLRNLESGLAAEGGSLPEDPELQHAAYFAVRRSRGI